MHLKTRQWF